MSAVEDEEDFGPILEIIPGDCEFIGRCQRCGVTLAVIRPDQTLDVIGERWDRHANSPDQRALCEQLQRAAQA